jgi:hypothetical protein
VDSLDLTDGSSSKISSAGSHILSIGGDALMALFYANGSGLVLKSILVLKMEGFNKFIIFGSRGSRFFNLSLGPHKRLVQEIYRLGFENQHQPPGCSMDI